MILQCMNIACTEKSQLGYDVSTGSGHTLQQTPKVLGSAEILRNQVTEPIVEYLLLPYLIQVLQRSPIPQTSNWSGPFFAVSYSKSALVNILKQNLHDL